ncbi:MAG TPA: cation:proton antiporter [Vicinamibacterales bacterium]|nr:cation:proton antiporter [Vicinamibacterales bacterium]
MHESSLILTIAGGLTSALVCGYLTQRLGLSPLAGYLLGGLLVGPHTPGFVADRTAAEQLAEIGVILLMFGVGLQFHLEDLLRVRRVAVPGALAQIATATLLGAGVGRAFGWAWPAAAVFGASLSVASTVVLVRVLSDFRDLHTPTGHIAVGWLVVEDLFTVAALVLLPVLARGAAEPASLLGALGLLAVKVAAVLVAVVMAGSRVIPALLDRVAATGSRELFTLTVLVLALGIAVGASLVGNVSMALGAFVAGIVVGRSEYGLRAASEALPMRDAFSVLFFVSVGMLLDPAHLVRAPALILATLAVILAGKPLAAIVIVRLLRYPRRVALGVAAALAQIGEFSFLLGALGEQLDVLPPEAMQTLVAASLVSIVLNPLLYRALPAVERWIARRPRLDALLNPPEPVPAAGAGPVQVSRDPRHRAVVVGYGPTGRTVTRLLRENAIEPTVVELNVESVRALRREGIDAIYGDANRPEVLEAAGLARAASLILSAAGMSIGAETIRTARALNPEVHVLARTAYLRDAAALQAAGADDVFSGEGEVALAMTEAILRRLGATPEQVDRERARVRRELRGLPDPAR